MDRVFIYSFAAFFWPRGHVDWIKLQAIYTKLTMSPVSHALFRVTRLCTRLRQKLQQTYSEVANGSPTATGSTALPAAPAASSTKKKRPAKIVPKAEPSDEQGPAYKKIKLIHHPYTAVAAAQPQLPSQYTAFAPAQSPEAKKEEESN